MGTIHLLLSSRIIKIKSFNLSFTYEKFIDEGALVSWNQNGNNVSSLSTYPIDATGANLKFQYKIDKNWTVYTTDKVSEINIYLNNNGWGVFFQEKS